MTLNVLIVEDHFIRRETLTDLIKHAPGFAVCGAVGTGEEALQQLAAVTADVVLVDLALPGMNGFDLVQALQAKQPAVPYLILSGHSKMSYVT